jgi:two-component system cell cycle sensor histidine kinase/response regulator CckA
MVGRFLENTEFLKEAKSFTRRDYGMPPWGIFTAFLIAFCLVLIAILFAKNILAEVAIVSVIMGGLLIVIYSAIAKVRGIISAAELQNAIFAGAAKLVTEFCMIIKYDGQIVYIDPKYQEKFFKQKKYSINIGGLYKNGVLSKKDLEKLELAISEGRKESINLILPHIYEGNSILAFAIEPIGIYTKFESDKKIRLAVKPIARPSGYFLVTAPKQDSPELREDQKDMYLKRFLIGTYSIRLNGEFKHVNDILENNLGYATDEITTLKISFKDLFYDSDAITELMNREENWQSIMPMRTKQNMIAIAMVSHRVFKDKKGKVMQRYGIIMPFTAQINNENTIVSDNNEFDFLTNSPIAAAILDTKANVQRSNKTFRIISQKDDKSDHKQWNLLDIVMPEERAQVKELVKNVINGKIDNDSIDIKIHSAGDITASLYINRIMDKYGAVKGLIANLIDTTEYKNLELRFSHSQKMQAVGQLAGGIAHDFNNLLTAMIGFCDLLLIRHPTGDQSFADIMQIKQNANRAANLVKQLLAFSRKQTLQPKILNITDILADLSSLIGRLIGENIKLKVTHGRDLGDVKVDQGQFEQVVINLAVNARDAMPDGGLLNIRTSNVIIDKNNKLPKSLIPPAEDEIIEDGEYVLVEVIDTGTGMAREEIGKIFEPFYSTKEIGAGTGLGLSTVYGIIKQTDGFIYVSSKLGKGSKFSIFLRKHLGSSYTNSKKEKAPPEKPMVNDLTGDGTILLVEDETPVRIFSNSALVSKGYNVFEADCAEAALQIMHEKGKQIHLIITDVVMPGMSGPDMIKKITEEYPYMKVIFMSGYGEDAFIESFGEDRKFNFLSKPYTLKQLATKVKEVLEEKS